MEYSKVKHGVVLFIQLSGHLYLVDMTIKRCTRVNYETEHITVSLFSTHFDPELDSGTQFPSDLGLALFNFVSLCG